MKIASLILSLLCVPSLADSQITVDCSHGQEHGITATIAMTDLNGISVPVYELIHDWGQGETTREHGIGKLKKYPHNRVQIFIGDWLVFRRGDRYECHSR